MDMQPSESELLDRQRALQIIANRTSSTQQRCRDG